MAAVSERDIVRAATSLGYTTVRENQMRAILAIIEFSKGSDVSGGGHYYAHYTTVRYRGQDVVKGSRGYFKDGQRVNMVNAPPKGQESRQQSTLLVDFELVKLTGEIQKPMLNNHNHNR